MDPSKAQSTPQAARATVLGALLLLAACGTRAPGPIGSSGKGSAGPASAGEASEQFAVQPLPLPGAQGVVTLDYFAYDRSRARLWVPAGNTASVDVIDGNTDAITRIQGFHT